MIKLTIAIPTYNRCQYLLETLKSIIPQINDDVEVIISDNASTDNTKEAIQEYIRKYNIKYYRNEKNLGMDYNFLNCMKKAKGKYIHLMSDDDLMFDNAVRRIINYIDTFDPDYIHLNSVSFWERTENCGQINRIHIEEDVISIDKDTYMEILGVYITYLSATIIKKENFEKIDNPERYIGTYFLHSHVLMETLKEKGKVIVTKEPYIWSRMHNSGGFNLYEVWVKQYKNLLLGTGVKSGFSQAMMKKIYIKDIKGFITDSILKYSIEKNIYDTTGMKTLFESTFMYPSICLKTYTIAVMPLWLKKMVYKNKRKNSNRK